MKLARIIAAVAGALGLALCVAGPLIAEREARHLGLWAMGVGIVLVMLAVTIAARED